MPAKIRNMPRLYRSKTAIETIDIGIRLRRTILDHSIYRADDQ
jgi:hypothetical protein